MFDHGVMEGSLGMADWMVAAMTECEEYTGEEPKNAENAADPLFRAFRGGPSRAFLSTEPESG